MAAKNGQNLKFFQIVSAVTATLTEIDYMFDNKIMYNTHMNTFCSQSVLKMFLISQINPIWPPKIGITAFFPLKIDP